MAEVVIREQPAVKKFCPFILEPLDACYCMKMGSQNIEKMLYFCGKNFESCEIFKRRLHGDKIKKQKLKISTNFYKG